MAKLTQYENPITGKKEDLFDIGGIFSKVVGVVIMLFVVATGQNLARNISGKTKLDTSLDPFIDRPAPVKKTSRVY
jgi:hypothetical protein